MKPRLRMRTRHPRVTRRFRDRGDLLMEAMVVIALAGVTLGGFAATSITSNEAQRKAQYTDVATQAGQGVIEKAKSANWSNLGFNAAQAGYTAVGRDGAPTVTVPTPSSAVSPIATTSLRGLNFTMNTDITWTSTPDSVGATDFGVKQIAVKVGWTDKAGKAYSTTVKSTRAPSISEAVPSNVANPAGPGNNVFPSLNVSPIDAEQNAQLQWRAASTYTSVIVERATRSDFDAAEAVVTGLAQGTQTDRALPRGEQVHYRVKAIAANGRAVYSETRSIFSAPPLSFASNGDITWGAYKTESARATLQMSRAVGEFSPTGMTEVALAGLSKVTAAQAAGYNTFRVKYETGGTVVYGAQLTRTNVALSISKASVVSSTDVKIKATWDRSASSVGARSLTLQVATCASFTCTPSETVITDAEATSALAASPVTSGAVFLRAGYEIAGRWTWSEAKDLTVQASPALTATVDKYTGAIVADVTNGPLSTWGATSATLRTAGKAGRQWSATSLPTTSAQQFLRSGEKSTLTLTLVNANDDSYVTQVPIERVTAPMITGYGAVDQNGNRRLTLSQTIDSFQGGDGTVAWLHTFGPAGEDESELSTTTLNPTAFVGGATQGEIRLYRDSTVIWTSGRVSF